MTGNRDADLIELVELYGAVDRLHALAVGVPAVAAQLAREIGLDVTTALEAVGCILAADQHAKAMKAEWKHKRGRRPAVKLVSVDHPCVASLVKLAFERRWRWRPSGGENGRPRNTVEDAAVTLKTRTHTCTKANHRNDDGHTAARYHARRIIVSEFCSEVAGPPEPVAGDNTPPDAGDGWYGWRRRQPVRSP
jgi:hypothetical protein